VDEMTGHDERVKKLKFRIETALEELAEKSSKFGPGSPEVEEAKRQRALREKDLYDFLEENAPSASKRR
jgi:hypothetical protein